MGKFKEFLGNPEKVQTALREAFEKYEKGKSGFIEERNISKAIREICTNYVDENPPADAFDDLDDTSDERFDFEQFSRIASDFLSSFEAEL